MFSSGIKRDQWHEMGYRNGGEQASSEEGVCVCTCVFVWKGGGVAKISFRGEIFQYLPLRKTGRVGLFGRGLGIFCLGAVIFNLGGHHEFLNIPSISEK